MVFESISDETWLGKYWNVFYVCIIWYLCELQGKGVFVKPTVNTQVTICRMVIFLPILLLFHELSRESGSSLTLCLCEILAIDDQF